MAVILITGRPGAGKTLSAVKMLIEDVLPTGRPVFADIDGLDYEGLGVGRLVQDEEDPVAGCQRWHEMPEGSVIFIDECQRVFPVRNPASKVPVWVSEFETHRHKGLDVYLITQGPRLIDRHIHDLVDRHVHLFRAFGLKRSTRYEWNGINLSPDPEQGKENAQKANFAFPAKYFEFYKSASVHTVKARIPWKPILTLAACVPLFVFLIASLYGRLGGPAEAQEVAEQVQRPEPPAWLYGAASQEQCVFRVHSVAPGAVLYQDIATGRLFTPSKQFQRVTREGKVYLLDLTGGNLLLIC
jgi:zona occludens toxin